MDHMNESNTTTTCMCGDPACTAWHDDGEQMYGPPPSAEELATMEAEYAWHERSCHAEFITGPAHDSYGTGCRPERRHLLPTPGRPGILHEEEGPYGGGTCAGDPLPPPRRRVAAGRGGLRWRS